MSNEYLDVFQKRRVVENAIERQRRQRDQAKWDTLGPRWTGSFRAETPTLEKDPANKELMTAEEKAVSLIKHRNHGKTDYMEGLDMAGAELLSIAWNSSSLNKRGLS